MTTPTSGQREQLRTDYAWTPRQREVLALIARGKTNGEIATALGVSLDGAKWHVGEILSKLGVDSRDEAAEYWRAYNDWPLRFSRAARTLATTGTLKWAAGFALAAATATVVIAVLASRGSSAPVAPATPASGSPPALPMLPVATLTQVASCDSASAGMILELIPAGDDIRIRWTTNGTTPCDLPGPGVLRLAYDLDNPPPALPFEANVTRRFRVNVRLPAPGVLGEWTWSNWCVPPGAYAWTLIAGPPEANPGAQVAVDRYPACLDPGVPTSLSLERLGPGVSGDITPSQVCRDRVAAWLCEFATDVFSRPLATWPRGGLPTTYTCPLAQRPEYSVLCQGAAAGTQVRGYPVVVHGVESGVRRSDEVESQLSDVFVYFDRAKPPPTLAAIGCLVEDPVCRTFVIAFATSGQYPVVYVAFRLERGREPAFIGAGFSGDHAEAILGGGTTPTVVGEMKFTSLQPPQ